MYFLCFLVYSVHINHFFLPYCKRLCIFFFFFFKRARIYVLSLLFLFTTCTSIIFFLPYCKNLYTFFVFFCLQLAHQSFFSSIRIYVLFFFFVYSVHINHFFLLFRIVRIYILFFRIRINILIVLESIIICLGYSFFFLRQLFLLSNFRQINCNNFLSPSISAMSLPQINSHNFFFLLFRQYYCHKFIPTIFFPSISAILLPQTNFNNFFSLLFWQCHCHIFIPTIPPPPLFQ